MLGYIGAVIESGSQHFTSAITKFYFNFFSQGFEDMVKAKKATKRPKGKDSESGTEQASTPPPAKQMHPSEQLKPRGFDRGLQAEKVI